jgi:hypothetical protein
VKIAQSQRQTERVLGICKSWRGPPEAESKVKPSKTEEYWPKACLSTLDIHPKRDSLAKSVFKINVLQTWQALPKPRSYLESAKCKFYKKPSQSSKTPMCTVEKIVSAGPRAFFPFAGIAAASRRLG